MIEVDLPPVVKCWPIPQCDESPVQPYVTEPAAVAPIDPLLKGSQRTTLIPVPQVDWRRQPQRTLEIQTPKLIVTREIDFELD